MKKRTIYFLLLVGLCFQSVHAQDPLLDVLKKEADRNLNVLSKQEVPAYYISYRVYDSESYFIGASFGNITNSQPDRSRLLQAFVRVGSPQVDNSHEIKGSFRNNSYYIGGNPLVLDNNANILQKALWKKTDELYKNAVKTYQNVQANIAVSVDAEDKSDDFSQEAGAQYYEKPLSLNSMPFNVKEWEDKLRKYSGAFSANKQVLNGRATLLVDLTHRYFADTDGAKIAENAVAYRLFLNASTIADDGMDIPLYQSYFAFNIKDLPSDEKIMADAQEMIDMLIRLKNAPVAESFTGPAIMMSAASGVFFHEIFGHRIEGARLKQETDAQTFKNKIGEQVLPKDISIIFDPQLTTYKGFDLPGGYRYDDEGVKGQRVVIVENGILKSFLMSRTPIKGFSNSNGHGRGQIYFNTVTRQSNTIVESSDPKSMSELRNLLIEEAKRTGKEYGYLFDEVMGGFTMTGRYIPNSFNVMPLIVYRIYTDGRPDELVRGVDLVGTPLTMFSQIAAAGNDAGIFNGFCGAESGSVPVSCVSPSIFVKIIETQKRAKSSTQPPILERPATASISSSK
ncbi:MAG: TldD/PmbA family protein [Candidatus Azobacteroides sp.]|nr:TldD/PmbA family protein [Candidatus Azobacteroides sp.]